MKKTHFGMNLPKAAILPTILDIKEYTIAVILRNMGIHAFPPKNRIFVSRKQRLLFPKAESEMKKMASMLTVDGIVVLERSVGDNDKYISILTENYGTLEVSAKGSKKITSKNHAATQLFAYSTFCLRINNGKYYLDSSEIKHDFYNLRLDIKKLSLACYFGELARHAVLATNRMHEHDIMRLMLNCLYFLNTDQRSCEFIKSVFELRFVTEIGLVPQLIGCRICYDYEADPMYFIIDKARFYCEEHFLEKGLEESYYRVKLSHAAFETLQHIALSQMEKLFNFRVSDSVQAKVNEVTEKYIYTQFGRTFKSLNYYHEICNPFEKGQTT
ncbi:MAG: DNA repair protein RecO [Oscillospiraceae bacterium]